MLQADAIRILARLKAGFPAVALTEPQTEVLLSELTLLHDARMLDIAVTQIIQRDERFPSIARIRATYKTNNEIAAASRAALERQAENPTRTEVLEWVSVWYWQQQRTLSDRQAANTTSPEKMAERPPVKMRTFPQVAEVDGLASPAELADAYTWEDYEQLRQEWIAAGSPSVGSALELAGAVA